MAAYFFDTSGIVKRYVSEVGTAWIQNLSDPAAGNEIYLSRITGAEVVAAIMRRVRRGDITAADAASAIALFRGDFETAYEIIEIERTVIARAMRLAERHILRGYDAVQLAAVLESNAVRLTLGLPAFILVSADVKLNAAAVAEGLTVEDPNTHP